MDPEYFGYAAALLTTGAYVPQTLKVLREKHTKSISLGMYAMMVTGLALWLVYGVLIGSPSLIIANGITFALAFAILLMKLRHG
jgi:MtN3 and saliva related transmembrane protein